MKYILLIILLVSMEVQSKPKRYCTIQGNIILLDKYQYLLSKRKTIVLEDNKGVYWITSKSQQVLEIYNKYQPEDTLLCKELLLYY